MKDLNGRIAVITGGGTGMGRELARLLAAAGCHVAMCDVYAEDMEQTRSLCEEDALEGVRITTHLADVAIEADILRFRDEVLHRHESDCVNFVFNNAGISGSGSMLVDERDKWERVFDICWHGVYYGTRAFLPLLVAADEGYLVNTSSVNGFFASGGHLPTTSYSAAKFAVKGFTEALITDLAIHAPHVKAFLVMPGHIGTPIWAKSAYAVGRDPKKMTEAELEEMRGTFERRGVDLSGAGPEEIRQMALAEFDSYQEDAATTAADAAKVILDAVLAGRWRILVGADAYALDEMVRADPEDAYTPAFFERMTNRARR